MPFTRTRSALAGAAAILAISIGVACPAAGAAVSRSAAGSPAVAATYEPQHAGGTLHLVAQSAEGTLDPQVNYGLPYWQFFQNTYDGLMGFQRKPGTANFKLVPDLATAAPVVSNGNKTYTFHLRKGIVFSNGKPVTLADVLASFQRIFKVHSPNAAAWYSVIVGANACLKTPATCTLKGGVVINQAQDSVTFNLVHPDAEFLFQLAVPFTSILPATAPPKDSNSKPIPGTGPYEFSKYDPNHELVMVRNKHFKVWSALAQPQGYPDEILTTFGLTSDNEVTAIENGQADWMYDAIPGDRLNELATKYPSQLHINPVAGTFYIPMNVNIPPFNNELARQAVDWAIDRNSLVKLFGGTSLAQPACTILPPGFPAYVPFCDYTKGGGKTWSAPDLDKAKALVQQSGTAGQAVALITPNDSVNESIGTYLVDVLNTLGYKATLKPLSGNIEGTYVQNTNNHVQISFMEWVEDYPAPADFLSELLGCATFHPGSDASQNIAGYCNKANDAVAARAENLEFTNPTAANKLWNQVERTDLKASAIAPAFYPKIATFVSKRVGNFWFGDQWLFVPDVVWVK
jgi:peptide/nickel transport system substrate-binding protein